MTCPKCNIELQILREENKELRRQLAYEINTQIAERLRLVFGLTKQQGAILEALRGAGGRVVSNEALDGFMEPVRDRSEDNDIRNLTKVQIFRIRRAMGPDVISNVRGIGYRLSDVGKLVVLEGLEKAGYFGRECA
jgi:DNA-binding response OmpR family regulator